MRLDDIAAKIGAHLKRFENDPKINKTKVSDRGLKPYYWANAWASSRWVYVLYVSYQGSSHLTKDEALKYLAWLDAGKVGRHYEALGRV